MSRRRLKKKLRWNHKEEIKEDNIWCILGNGRKSKGDSKIEEVQVQEGSVEERG